MITATVKYSLDKQGQRNEIKEGRSGHRQRIATVHIEAQDVDLFDTDDYGHLSCTFEGEFRAIPNEGDLLEAIRTERGG